MQLGRHVNKTKLYFLKLPKFKTEFQPRKSFRGSILLFNMTTALLQVGNINTI